MKIADSTVLVTGANRGLGKALVEEALRRGAKRVYAGARQPFAHADRRVTPVMLDVTNAEEIFPDPMSEAIAEGWRSSAVKALQRQFAAYAEQTPVKSKAAHPSVRG